MIMIPLLVVASLFQYSQMNDLGYKIKDQIKFPIILKIIAAALAGNIMSILQIYLSFQNSNEILLLSSLSGPIIIFIEIFKDKFVHKLEIFGTTLCIIGLCLTVLSPMLDYKISFTNFLLAILESLCTILYLKYNEDLCIRLPSLLSITIINMVG